PALVAHELLRRSLYRKAARFSGIGEPRHDAGAHYSGARRAQRYATPSPGVMPMARCIQAVGAFLAPGCAIVLLARAVLAAPSDASATKLRDDAIDNDYLATSYASAEAKLKSALTLCKGPADCSP